MDFARVMDLIIGHMEARGSRWAVAGGLAMQGHGLAERMFPQCRDVPWTTGRALRLPLPQHLIAMKVHAMKNDPSRTFREMADIQYLMKLPDVDRASVRWYFEKAGLLERYEEILRVL